MGATKIGLSDPAQSEDVVGSSKPFSSGAEKNDILSVFCVAFERSGGDGVLLHTRTQSLGLGCAIVLWPDANTS